MNKSRARRRNFLFLHGVVIPFVLAVIICVSIITVIFSTFDVLNANPLSTSTTSLFNISSDINKNKVTKNIISNGFDYTLDKQNSSSQMFNLINILGLPLPNPSSDCKPPLKETDDLFPGEKYFSSHNDNFVSISKDGDLYEGHFLLSFKTKVYTLFEETFPTSLYFAYTQLIVTDLSADSIPITEINVAPEVFLMFQSPSKSGFKLDRMSIGFYHQSNGVGDPIDESSDTLSRSWDNYYIEVAGAYVWDKNIYIKTNFRYWEPVGSLTDNPDIIDYYGNKRSTWSIRYNDYSLSYMIQNKIKALTLYINFLDSFEPNLFFQIHNGYGFTLNNYNTDDTRYRIGISY